MKRPLQNSRFSIGKLKHQDSASSTFANNLMAIMYKLKQPPSVLHMHKHMRQITFEKAEDFEIIVPIVHDG
jgi:hypothetical protein